MIKLVAIDLDGTLLDPNRQITAEVKSAVKKAKAAGVKIVITTGRPLPGVVDILKALELTDQSDYVITYNGGLVQRATGEEFIKVFCATSKSSSLKSISTSSNTALQRKVSISFSAG